MQLELIICCGTHNLLWLAWRQKQLGLSLSDSALWHRGRSRLACRRGTSSVPLSVVHLRFWQWLHLCHLLGKLLGKCILAHLIVSAFLLLLHDIISIILTEYLQALIKPMNTLWALPPACFLAMWTKLCWQHFNASSSEHCNMCFAEHQHKSKSPKLPTGSWNSTLSISAKPLVTCWFNDHKPHLAANTMIF